MTQLKNKKTANLPLATLHIACLCNQFNHVLVLLISAQHFKCNNFYQYRPKIMLFLQKNTSFRALGTQFLDSRASGGCGCFPQTPKSPLHCKFLSPPQSLIFIKISPKFSYFCERKFFAWWVSAPRPLKQPLSLL